MSKTQEIKEYFETDRSFLPGVMLFNKHGRNLTFLRILNTKGETKDTLAKLHYQLWKVSGIPEKEWKALMMSDPISKDPVVRAELIPEPVKKTIKLREEFPFLKDPECPRELKALVADMLSAYDNYKDAHSRILDEESEEMVRKLSQLTVESFLENRSIWDELNHFKANNELLGEHPIFIEMKFRDTLKDLSADELSKRKNNVRANITKTNKKIFKDPEDEKVGEWTEKVKVWEFEFPLLDAELKSRK